MAAKIHPLPGKDWNAHAALGDAMQRTGLQTPIIIIWYDDEGRIRFSSSNMAKKDVVWAMEEIKADALGISPVFRGGE